MWMRAYALSVLFGAAGRLQAQSLVMPVRPIGAVVARGTSTYRTIDDVRELPGGRILLNAMEDHRLQLLDSTLAVVSTAGDSATGPALRYGGFVRRLLPFRGDSSLLTDPNAHAVQVLDGQGAVVRTFAYPRPLELPALATMGLPGVDPRGRIVYMIGRSIVDSMGSAAVADGAESRGAGVGNSPPKVGPGQDPPLRGAASVVRLDVETRRVTTATLVQRAGSNGLTVTADEWLYRGFDPLKIADDWILTPDGTIVVARGATYNLEFFGMDGSKRIGPTIPYEWQRMSDAWRIAYHDSLMNEQAWRLPRMGPGWKPRRYELVAASDLPSSKPVFFHEGKSMRADLEGNVWIKLFDLRGVRGGTVYDVIDSTGRRADRVQLPVGRSIVTFGKGGTVYMTADSPNGVVLEKARVR